MTNWIKPDLHELKEILSGTVCNLKNYKAALMLNNEDAFEITDLIDRTENLLNIIDKQL